MVRTHTNFRTHPFSGAVFSWCRAFCFLLRRETWSSGYDGKKKENAKITTPGMCIPLVHAYIIWTANFRTHHSHIAVFVYTLTLFPCDWYLFFNASIILTQRGTQTQAHKAFKFSMLVCSIHVCVFMVPLPLIHLLLRVCS